MLKRPRKKRSKTGKEEEELNWSVIVAVIIILLLAIYIVPWQEVELLTEVPAYQSHSAVVNVTLNGEAYQIEFFVTTRGTEAISAANILTMNVAALAPVQLSSVLNVTEMTFTPDQGNLNPLNSSNLSKNGYILPAVITLTPDKSIGPGWWYGNAKVVYFTSGTFNATVNVLNSQATVPSVVQVSGQDVTFQYVNGLLTISLTLVLVAFVLLEFRKVKRDSGKKNQTKIDDYLIKVREDLKSKLRRVFRKSGKNDKPKGKHEPKQTEPEKPSLTEPSNEPPQ